MSEELKTLKALADRYMTTALQQMHLANTFYAAAGDFEDCLEIHKLIDGFSTAIIGIALETAEKTDPETANAIRAVLDAFDAKRNGI